MDTIDLAIVGGGIVGLMTALLARRRFPNFTIAVFERSLIGHGATQYSACLDIPYGATPAIRSLVTRSSELYRIVRTEVPGLPILDLELYGVCAEHRLAFIVSQMTIRDEDRRKGLECGTRAPRTITGFRAPQGTVVFGGLPATRCADPSLSERLAVFLEAQPETFLVEGTEIVHVSPEGNSHRLDVHDGRHFLARRVALCLGPWLARHSPLEVDISQPIRTKKVVSFHIPIEPQTDASVVYLFDHDAFLLPQPERRRWLFSCRSEQWDCEPEVSRLCVAAADRERARSIIDLYFPIEMSKPWGARIFCDGYTATSEPLIERLAALPCCVVAGGCSGSGIRLAPGIADRVVDLIG